MSRITLLLGLMTLVVVGQVYAQPASLSAYRAAVQADNPSGFWYLDETSGTTAADASSVGGFNDGSWVPGISSIPGFTAGSTAFNSTGNTDWIQIPDTFSDNSMSTQEFTIEHWVKGTPDAGDPENTFVRGFFFGGGCCTAQFLQEGSDGNWSAGVSGGGNGKVVTAPNTSDAWSHVVMTAKPSAGGTDLTIYVDGVSAGTHTTDQTASNDSGEDITIGVLEFGGDGDPYGPATFGAPAIQGFIGGIDEVAYYPYALSAEQVAAHYNAPEPSTLVLLGLGLLFVMCRSSKK